MAWTSGVLKHVLPNGLILLVQREASAPVVAVVTHVKAERRAEYAVRGTGSEK